MGAIVRNLHIEVLISSNAQIEHQGPGNQEIFQCPYQIYKSVSSKIVLVDEGIWYKIVLVEVGIWHIKGLLDKMITLNHYFKLKGRREVKRREKRRGRL